MALCSLHGCVLEMMVTVRIVGACLCGISGGRVVSRNAHISPFADACPAPEVSRVVGCDLANEPAHQPPCSPLVQRGGTQ